MDTGALGTVPHIKTHFSGNVAGRYKPRHCHIAPCESPAGGLAGSGIHSTDAITHLAGAITEVYAVTTKREHELDMDDTTMVTFKLASGAVAPLLTITASTPTWRIVFYGTRGKARAGVAADRRGAETLEVSLVTGDRRPATGSPAAMHPSTSNAPSSKPSRTPSRDARLTPSRPTSCLTALPPSRQCRSPPRAARCSRSRAVTR